MWGVTPAAAAELRPVSVTELLGSAQRFPVLGLGPAFLFMGSASPAASGSSPEQCRFSSV